MNALLAIVSFIFDFANRFVELIGGLFAVVVNYLMKLVGHLCSWIVEVIANSDELQVPIVLFLVIVGIMAFCAVLVYSPYILGITFIVIPLSIFLLKLFLGWILLIGIVYFIYRKLKRLVRWLKHLVLKNKKEVLMD